MGRANAKLDAYAHHPYPVQPQTETPWSGGCKHCQTISMASLERLTAAVRSARAETHLVDRVWLPDEPARPWLGIEPALQAIYTAEAALRVWKAPYVDMLINFLYQDDIADSNGSSSGWQSGFVTARGAPKPSLRAFMLPLVRASRHGEQTTCGARYGRATEFSHTGCRRCGSAAGSGSVAPA